jgi:hypothetical protein
METKTNARVTQVNINCSTKTQQKIASYNGNINDYYMVDYFDNDQCRWVRCPFNTLEQVAHIASSIVNGREVEGFRVIPEKWLSQLRDNTWNEETNSYTEDVITNRTWLFGSRYEELAEHITGERSLMRDN